VRHEGACLEHLGRYGEAAKVYRGFLESGRGMEPDLAVRLVRIHEAAGRLGALEGLAERSPDLRRALEFLGEAQAGKIDSLVAVLAGADGHVTGGEDLRRKALLAWCADLLARFPEKSVPLLLSQLERGEPDAWILYALGRCGTRKSVSVVEKRARSVRNCWVAATVVVSLAAGGAEGEQALARLETDGSEALRSEIERRRRDRKDLELSPSYPPLPEKIDLEAR
jgi:hypothetical protein